MKVVYLQSSVVGAVQSDTSESAQMDLVGKEKGKYYPVMALHVS